MIKIKIAISSTGQDLESKVDLRFGRCPFYLIVDIENNEVEHIKALENPAATQGGGAGIAAAEFIANEEVKAVITVSIGPNAFKILNELNIKVYKSEGIIKDVVEKFIGGKLQELEAPNNPMSFGRGLGKGGGRGQGGGFGRGNM